MKKYNKGALSALVAFALLVAALYLFNTDSSTCSQTLELLEGQNVSVTASFCESIGAEEIAP